MITYCLSKVENEYRQTNGLNFIKKTEKMFYNKLCLLLVTVSIKVLSTQNSTQNT